MRATSAGANIRGTPPMPAPKVKQDLTVLKRVADIILVQEFRWSWYWRVMSLTLIGWGSFPGQVSGKDNPTNGGQAIFWKRRLFKLMDRYLAPAFDFALDNAGIMENRFIRAALLRAKKDGFTAWYLSTHFVVGGDESGDGSRRKVFMHQNIDALDKALTHMQRTGYPIMGELDANIHKNSEAYDEFMKMMRSHGATFHGEKGVEYAFTINGRRGTWTKVRPDTIPTSELNTDHETRLLHWTGAVR